MESFFNWIKGNRSGSSSSPCDVPLARVKVKFSIFCMQQDGSVAFQIKTRDISEFDMGFTSSVPLVKGEKVKLMIQSPLDYSTITVRGKVSSVRTQKKSCSGRIDFLEMSDEDRGRLRKAISKFKVS